MKKFRALVVSVGGCHEEIIIQGVMAPTGVLPNRHSCLIRKGYITGTYVHAPIQNNSLYTQMVRLSIYDTRQI